MRIIGNFYRGVNDYFKITYKQFYLRLLLPNQRCTTSNALLNLVRLGGLEPPQLAPPPPQDGVSTNSTTIAYNLPLKPACQLFLAYSVS